MKEEFSRTELLLGNEAMEKLKKSSVIVFGVGGVGGHVVEALIRSGIGHIAIVDHDTVDVSNINRQLVALHSTIGRSKVEILKERLLDINPELEVEAIEKFYLPENEKDFDLSKYDYVVDAVDNMSAKISLVIRSNELGVPVISAMGAGNKLDPTKLEVSDIYKTSVDPLAKILRHELKKRNIKHLKVVYSKEEPIKVESISEDNRRAIPGSTSFVPSAMGLIIASEVIKDLIKL